MKWKTLAAVAFLMVMSANPVASQTLTVSVTGSGKVTGTKIDCPPDCSETFPLTKSVLPSKPMTVLLTAAVMMGFSGPMWGGACQGTSGPTCTVTVPAGGAIVSAGFVMPDVSRVGPGSIRINPSGMVPDGTVVTYFAEPNAGVSFAGWSGVCTGSNPVCRYTFSSSSPTTLKASFGYPVTVTIEGNGAPDGRVTGKGIDCPTVCTVVAVPPTLILEGTSASSAVGFTGWGGAADCNNTKVSCSLFIKEAKSVTATFRILKLPLP